jgi:hypothetical protein
MTVGSEFVRSNGRRFGGDPPFATTADGAAMSACPEARSTGPDAVDVLCYLFLRRWLTARGQEAIAA